MPPQMEVPSLTIPMQSEEIARPPLVIRPSVNHVALTIDASRLKDADFARALLRATIDPDNFKEICTSLKDVMMRSYGSRYEVTPILISPFFCSYVLLRLIHYVLRSSG